MTPFDPRDRTNVALDIETGGFGASDPVTVVGLLPADREVTVVVNSAGRAIDSDRLAREVRASASSPVDVTVATDERALLVELGNVVFERVDRHGNRIVAYNGETFTGGFDFPFLRTRCSRRGVEWPFGGYTFSDLYPMIEQLFNTTVSSGAGEDRSGTDLVTAHRLLCHPEREFDPFEDSAEAVDAFRAGEFSELVLHNASDIHRTLDLAELACRYVPARAFDDYKL